MQRGCYFHNYFKFTVQYSSFDAKFRYNNHIMVCKIDCNHATALPVSWLHLGSVYYINVTT